jgi:trehalose 6-phosphate phosphatase
MADRPAAINALAADPPSSGLVLDFDGVLAPIVADPTQSAMPGRVTAALGRLATRLGLLAVVSGRPAVFLEDRVRVPGIPLLGSYGMEQSRDGKRQVDPAAQAWLGKVDEADSALRDLLGSVPGVRIERKAVSVAAHWRQAPDHAAASALVREAAGQVARQTGLRLEPGKLVEELRPPVDVDKGSTVAALLATRKPEAFAFAGDDLGDIPALRAVRAAGGYALVVDHGPETDPRVLAAADETFAGTEGFADWLTELAGAAGA